ncbi:hypothetical protein VWZ88_18795 [Phaeobacter sp. JH20_36]|uniref:hypothetical protein n=1 Tax=unclassified Phaeobacter TaxID=2621772 RepID=UPI003A881B84
MNTIRLWKPARGESELRNSHIFGFARPEDILVDKSKAYIENNTLGFGSGGANISPMGKFFDKNGWIQAILECRIAVQR